MSYRTFTMLVFICLIVCVGALSIRIKALNDRIDRIHVTITNEVCR